MIENKTDKHICLFEICFGLYATWYFLPIARGFFWGGVWNVLFFGFYVLAIAFALLKNLKLDMKPLTGAAAFPIIAYMVVFLFYCYLDISYAKEHIRVSFTFWGTFIFFMFTEKYPESQKRMAKYLILMFVVTYATTYFNLVANPSIARMLTDASVEQELRRSEMMKNIGDIYVVQMSVLFIPFLMDVLFFRAKNWYYKFAGIAVLVLEFYFLLTASFTIALITYIAAVVLSFIFLSKNKDTMDVVIKLTAVVVFSLVLLNVDWANVFGTIADSIGNDYIAQRFKGLEAMFSTGMGSSSDISSRPEYYMMSIQTFISNPMGVGPNYSYVPGHQGIGMHSQIFDDLARYGILAVAFYLMFFTRYYKMLYEKFKAVGRQKLVLPTMLVYIIFLCVNIGFRSPYESLIMLFVYPALPLLISNANKGKGEENELKESAEK